MPEPIERIIKERLFQQQYVCAFAFSDDWEYVLLIRKARPEWQKGRLNGIGGKVEAGETPIQAMHREWEEETGQDPRINKWVNFACLSGWNESGPFGVWFFRTEIDIERLRSIRCQSPGEEFGRYPITYFSTDYLPNLSWLIPMAHNRNRRDWPFCISEQTEVFVASCAPPTASIAES